MTPSPPGKAFLLRGRRMASSTAGRFAQGCTAPSLGAAAHAPPAMHRCAKARLPQPGRGLSARKCRREGSPGRLLGEWIRCDRWWRRDARRLGGYMAADPPRDARQQHGAAVYQRKRYATAQRRIQRGIPSVWRRKGYAAAQQPLHHGPRCRHHLLRRKIRSAERRQDNGQHGGNQQRRCHRRRDRKGMRHTWAVSPRETPSVSRKPDAKAVLHPGPRRRADPVSGTAPGSPVCSGRNPMLAGMRSPYQRRSSWK